MYAIYTEYSCRRISFHINFGREQLSDDTATLQLVYIQADVHNNSYPDGPGRSSR